MMLKTNPRRAIDPRQNIMHLMGEPDETRQLIVHNDHAVLSPPWSIHSGAGTLSCPFIWAFSGDNVDYIDVELVVMEDLR
jgi:4-deoxy-L-threo-5-hexosulose-uronate ketol-isomerase